MRCENYQDSILENWLRQKNMSTNELVRMVGCSRPIIWKVKRGIPICAAYAIKIMQITDGEIVPSTNEVGRPRFMNTST